MGNINIQMVSKVLGINEVTQEECLKLEEGLKTKRYHFTPDRTVSSKSLQITNVGEDVEKREPFSAGETVPIHYCTYSNYITVATMENIVEFLKNKNRTTMCVLSHSVVSDSLRPHGL